MSEEKEVGQVCCSRGKRFHNQSRVGGGIYGLAFIGALIYFLQTATTFWLGILGILKAMVWPAILVYNILKFLNL